MDGNKLLAAIQSSNTREWATGYGYVLGVADAFESDEANSAGDRFCFFLPKEVKAGQIIDVIKLHLEASPAQRHLEADVLVRYALSQAFPCKR